MGRVLKYFFLLPVLLFLSCDSSLEKEYYYHGNYIIQPGSASATGITGLDINHSKRYNGTIRISYLAKEPETVDFKYSGLLGYLTFRIDGFNAIFDQIGDNYRLHYRYNVDTFEKIEMFRITIDPGIQNGEIVLVGGVSVDDNDGSIKAEGRATVTMTAIPEPGFILSESPLVTNKGRIVQVNESGANWTFSMPRDAVTVTAKFIPLFSIIVDQDITGGKISANPASATEGATVTLTLIPDDGYTLDGSPVVTWSGGDIEVTGTGTNWTFKMPGEAVTVTAVFVEIEVE